jgi:hypothetical protein
MGQIPLIIALTRAFENILHLVVRFYDLNRLSYMYRNTYTESLRLRLRDSYILYNILYIWGSSAVNRLALNDCKYRIAGPRTGAETSRRKLNTWPRVKRYVKGVGLHTHEIKSSGRTGFVSRLV